MSKDCVRPADQGPTNGGDDANTGNDTTVSTLYVVDANSPTGYSQVLEEWNPAGTPAMKRSYTIGQDMIAQWDSTNGVLYLLADGHGSTRLLTTSTGAVALRKPVDNVGSGISKHGRSRAQRKAR